MSGSSTRLVTKTSVAALVAAACLLALGCKKKESGSKPVAPIAPVAGQVEQTEAGPPDAKASVKVELRLPVETFHILSPPLKPVEIVLQNQGRAPIAVPMHYDGDEVRLAGHGREHPRQVVLFPVEPRPPAQEHVALEPGESRTVLSVFLGEILRMGYLRASGGPPSPVWRWDWPLRSAPPVSPIHKMRTKGYCKAVFWVEVEVGSETLYSERVVLEVQDFHDPFSGR
jgi:hypothetical protein